MDKTTEVVSQMPAHIGSHISTVSYISDERLRVLYRSADDQNPEGLSIFIADACISITREQWNTLAAAVEAVLPVLLIDF